MSRRCCPLANGHVDAHDARPCAIARRDHRHRSSDARADHGCARRGDVHVDAGGGHLRLDWRLPLRHRRGAARALGARRDAALAERGCREPRLGRAAHERRRVRRQARRRGERIEHRRERRLPDFPALLEPRLRDRGARRRRRPARTLWRRRAARARHARQRRFGARAREGGVRADAVAAGERRDPWREGGRRRVREARSGVRQQA